MAKKRQLQAADVEQLENTSMAIFGAQDPSDSTTIVTRLLPESLACCVGTLCSITGFCHTCALETIGQQ